MEHYDNEAPKVARVSSCRGVSFEINSTNKVDLFAIESPKNVNDHHSASLAWMQWAQKIQSHFGSMDDYVTPPSSHFCDFDDSISVSINKLFEDESFMSRDFDIEKQELPCNILACSQKGNRHLPLARPRSKHSRLSTMLLDQGLFTVYKRLFLVCLILNVVGLVLATTNHFPYAKKRASLFSIGNILALTMCRSEALLRVVFWFAVKIFGWSWMPLCVKTRVTSLLQGLGGIHSGCGVSSIAWLVYALILTLEDKENTSPEIIAVACAILGLISLSSLAAFPLVRHLHHNMFERTHRFAGWSALGLLWAFIILKKTYEPKSKYYHFHPLSFVKDQEFWLTFATTILIIIPWLTIRKVKVKVSAPSGHASLIKFQGGVKAGLLARISPSPLSEWHAFGIISDGAKEHMILAGAVGDYTRSLVSRPPSHIWVRGMHFAGLPYLVNMYQKVVLVATGSGICVFLSFLLQPCKADVYLVWVAKGIENSFGKEIKDMVNKYPEEKLLICDTALCCRPDVAELSVNAAKKWKAEVLIVTSNPEGTRDVVKACNKAGIPAFGPIWDS